MPKKIAAAFGIIGFLASVGIASAAATTAPAATPSPSQPVVLTVSAGGKTLLRGTITAVSSGSVTMKSWGGDWTVNVPSSAEVLPSGAALASFAAGDFVGVQGTIDSNSAWTVDATLIRDWTARQALQQEIKSNRQVVQQTETNAAHTIEGTLSGLDATAATFTLTSASGTAYTVTLDPSAKILGKNWATISLGRASNGDMVRVFGTVSGTGIAASVFRDVSIK